MAKPKESLEEGLDRSATKRNFRGKKRHQYIGGAIRNMEKKGEIGKLKHKPAAPKQKGMFGVKPPPKKKEAKPRKVKPKPEVKREETPVRVPQGQIKLSVRKNDGASHRLGYNVYSVYYAGRNGKQFSSATHRSKEAAKKEAGLAEDAHNGPRGIHTQSSFGPRQRQYLKVGG